MVRRAMHKDMEEHHCHERNEYQEKQLAHGELLLAADAPFLL
jgi:hypothetical protein